MSLALSMKSLVEDVRSSRSDRHAWVKDSRNETRALISRFDKELKEMAADLRKFLADSEASRKEDFGIVMRNIRGSLKDIKDRQAEVRKETRALIKEYAVDSTKAREYWLSLTHKPRAATHKAEAES